MTKAEELCKTIAENPDLPILPIVSNEVGMYDYWTWYSASWGGVQVDEYLIVDDVAYLRSEELEDDGIYSLLWDYLSQEEWDSLPDDDEERRKVFEALPWQKAVIVFITPLE